jgi:hypothetical protein
MSALLQSNLSRLACRVTTSTQSISQPSAIGIHASKFPQTGLPLRSTRSYTLSPRSNDSATVSAFSQASNQRKLPQDDLPKFSLKDLGATRTVKIVVYTALAICGTAESTFWFLFIKERYFTDPEVVREREEGTERGLYRRYRDWWFPPKS